ncbi:hypothetical protein MSA03_22550 [Microbacterium saccharophilum]|nr:hypothetical protein MSA03_22550 [Microbacterium saccharophilum]
MPVGGGAGPDDPPADSLPGHDAAADFVLARAEWMPDLERAGTISAGRREPRYPSAYPKRPDT